MRVLKPIVLNQHAIWLEHQIENFLIFLIFHWSQLQFTDTYDVTAQVVQNRTNDLKMNIDSIKQQEVECKTLYVPTKANATDMTTTGLSQQELKDSRWYSAGFLKKPYSKCQNFNIC